MRSLPLLCLSIALSVASAAHAAPLPRESVYALDAPLVDQSGRALQLADKRGRAQIVVMFYTSCSFICPTIIDTVQDLDRKLSADERQRLGVLMISLDPQRDGPAALKATADKRQLDTSRWTLAQPRPTDLRAIAGVLGVRYRPLANGEINHTGVLVLLDAEGRVVARSAKTSGAVEPQFLEQVQQVLASAH